MCFSWYNGTGILLEEQKNLRIPIRCEINCCNDRERTERRAKKIPLIKNWEFSPRESCVNKGHGIK